MNRVRQLYRLQTVELELDEVKHRLREIEVRLGGSEELQRARRAAEEAETQRRRWQAKLRDLELETEGLTEKIARVKEKLYSGWVSNPKELAALQEEVNYLERGRERREDEMLKAMIAVEEKEEELEKRREELARLEEEWHRERERLRGEWEAVGGRLNRLSGERDELRRVISADDLALYKSLRRRRGRAVALLDGRVCRGCGVSLPSGTVQQAQRGEGLSFCDSCGRILYAK